MSRRGDHSCGKERLSRQTTRDEADGHGRQLALTRARRPRDELIRFVLAPDGTVVPDLKERLPGRGCGSRLARRVADAVERKVFAVPSTSRPRFPKELPATVERLLAEAALVGFGACQQGWGGHVRQRQGRGGHRGGPSFGPDPCQGSGRGRLPQARGKARDASFDRPIPAVRAFGTDELGLATGRTNVIHAALIQGGAAESVLAAASRLERNRKGKAAFVSENGNDTDKE